MAANVQTQILADTGTTTTLKVMGNLAGANTVNTVILQANTLYGANASLPCLLTITKIYHAVSMGGKAQLEWVGSSANTAILAFGGNSSAQLFDVTLTNNAVNPTGDLNLNLVGSTGDVFNFVIVLNKERGTFGANAGAWANTYKGY